VTADQENLRYVSRLHEAVVRYAQEASADDLLPAHLEQARHHGLAAAALFLGQPRGDELQGLRELGHADDVAQEVRQPVVQPLTATLIGEIALARVRGTDRTTLTWKRGAVAVSSPLVHVAVRLLARPRSPQLSVLRQRVRRLRSRLRG
jgi:uncharacterized protein YigA (DUF484 family)